MAEAKEMTITQIRSANGANPSQRETLRSLRLGRIGKETTRADSEMLRGMLNRVSHLVVVEEKS